MQKAYNQYSLYRGYYDIPQGESKNLPPIEEVMSKIKEEGPSGIKATKYKEEFNRLKSAWGTVSNEPYEAVRDTMVADDAYKIGPEGVTDESIKKIYEIKNKNVDIGKVLEPMEKIEDIKPELEEKYIIFHYKLTLRRMG